MPLADAEKHIAAHAKGTSQNLGKALPTAEQLKKRIIALGQLKIKQQENGTFM